MSKSTKKQICPYPFEAVGTGLMSDAKKIVEQAPLSMDFVKEAEELAIKAGKSENRIIKRINYIMESIFKLFKQNQCYWHFYGAEQGGYGDCWSHFNGDVIDIIVEDCSNTITILLDSGEEWDITENIPYRWLFEDFDKELKEGKKAFEQKELIRIEKHKKAIAAKKQEDKTLIVALKKKLSKEEIAAIKRMKA